MGTAYSWNHIHGERGGLLGSNLRNEVFVLRRLKKADNGLAGMKLFDLGLARAADLEENVGLLPDGRGPVDKSGAGLIVRVVEELGLSACTLLDKNFGEAFLEQEGDILGRQSNASLVEEGLAGNADSELAVWDRVGDDSRRVLCARSSSR